MMRKPNTVCSNCDNPIYRRPAEIKKRKNLFCSDCRKLHMINIATYKNEKQYQEYIKKWKRGEVDGRRGKYSISKYIIRYLFRKYNNKCCECGWCKMNKHTGKIPIEIEHIDGDFTNNNEENLKLLCPNCHSLTPTYKGANKGHGRKKHQPA